MSLTENCEKPTSSPLDTERLTDSSDSSRSSSPGLSPTVMRTITFPLTDSDGSSPASPTPSIMSITEAEWLEAIRVRSFHLYRLAKRKPIPMVRPRLYRIPLEADNEDEVKTTEAADENDNDGDSSKDGDTDVDGAGGDDGCLKVSEKDEAESAARVSILFQRLSMCVTAHNKDKPAKGDEVPKSKSKPKPKSLDWNAAGQLEEFLERCVEGWEMQNRYLAQQERLLRAMEKMHKRIVAAEDENALLVWYVNHLKGGLTGRTVPVTADTSAAILQEAHAAILNIATASVEVPKPPVES